MAPMFVPGPVDVDPEVLDAQTKAVLPHRSKEYEKIFHRAEGKMRPLFGTKHRVFITASSGSGLQEAAVRNLANQRVLACVNGAFSQRWFNVALSNGKNVDRVDAEWGQPITVEMVAEQLKKGDYEILTIVHNETSVGLENPVEKIAKLVSDVSPETLVCVDAVSSLGGVEFLMDDWGVDFVLTSSQKALALPPGLGFAATSDRALHRAENVENRGWYFDLLKMEDYRLRNSTPATSAVTLVYALDRQMERIHEEGLQARFARHRDMAEKVREWALSKDFSLFAAEGYQSKTVTTVSNTHEIDIAELNQFLLERDMLIANGYGSLKNKTFRIAHMGETQPEDLNELFQSIDEFMGW